MWKNKIFNTFLCVVASFALFNFALAYDSQTTHPNLTDITVELYNLKGLNKILQSEKYWIKKGSMDEDKGMRCVNHFYDPVYNRTWKMGGIEGLIPEVTSKIWVNDQSRQSSYDVAFLASLKIMSRSYLESNANQTYNMAIYEYLKGNKKDAFYTLGHVLHLLQDLTSVPHTRADAHMGQNDQSSYEISSTYKTVDDFKNLYEKFKTYQIIKRSSVEDYFYNVALYTNNNFYSEDTIMSYEYNKPEVFQSSAVNFVNGSDLYYVLGWDKEEQNVYRLAKKIGRDWKASNFLNKYEINDPLVFEDYWSRLSKKAVLEGAGLVDLFFKDVERKRNDAQFYAMMEQKHGVSFFVNLIGDVKQATKYLASLFNQHPDDVIIQPPNTTKVGLSNTTTSLVFNPTTTTKKNIVMTTSTIVKPTTTTKKQTTTTTKKVTTTTTKKQTTTTTKRVSSGGGVSLVSKCDFVLNLNLSQDKKVIFNEIAWAGSLNNYSDEWIELKNISNEKVDISLWEIMNSNKSIKIVIPEGTFLNPSEMFLLERTDDNTVLHVKKDLIFVGAIRNDNEELRLFDKNCNVLDNVIAVKKWPAGDSASKRTAERKTDFSWYTSSAPCINGVCGTPKAENSIYSSEFNSVEVATTTTTVSTTTTTVPEEIATTTTTTVPEIAMGEIKRIVFSEIRVSGQNADDEFIELYNPLEEDVNLTGWKIKQKSSDSGSLVSGEYLENKIIPSKGYFLITNKQEGKYTGDVLADTTFNSVSYSLVDNQVIILSDEHNREVDRIGWGIDRVDGECEGSCLSNLVAGNTFERKAQEGSTSEDMVNGQDRLKGNGYDSDNNSLDFIIRAIGDPQNSQSLKEPREDVVDESNNWGKGFALKNFNFYYLNSLKERAFIEFDIEKYPFWNVEEENDDRWRAMVFYLNSEDGKMSSLTSERNNNNVGYAGWQVSGNDSQVVLMKYGVCGGDLNTKFGSSFDSSLIFPHTIGMSGDPFVCDANNVSDHYNVPNSIAYNYNSNVNHVKVEVTGVLGAEYEKNYNIKELFKEGDYLTIGFYKGVQGASSNYLDSTELIYEDNTKYLFNTNEFKKIEVPKNLAVSYNSENYIYNLSWDKMENEEGIAYSICIGAGSDSVGSKCYDSNISLAEGKWNKSINLEDIPYGDGKVFFGVRAWSSEYEIFSEYSNIVEDNVYPMPKKINEYISNVFWGIKNDRMVLEFDLNRLGKFGINTNPDHYNHTLLTAWEYSEGVGLGTCAHPNVYVSNGTVGDFSCGNLNNNGRIRLFNYSGAMTKGHKEIVIKFLAHPMYKDLSIYNADGLTMEDLNKLVKSESNPDGILNSLSEMFLVLDYGVRYEPYCGYWVYDGNFGSFTPDTNLAPNQIKYYFSLPN